MKVDVIFCDDVRLEVSGKHTLVGVYPNGMSYSGTLPGAIRFACWVRISGISRGPHHVQFAIMAPGSAVLDWIVEIDLTVNNPNLPTAFRTDQYVLPLSEVGDVDALISIDGSAYEKVGFLNVVYAYK